MSTADAEAVIKNQFVVSPSELYQFRLFGTLTGAVLYQIRSFVVFESPPQSVDPGTSGPRRSGILYVTFNNDVYGLGYNGYEANLLGLTGSDYRAQEVYSPSLIGDLSGADIRVMSIGEWIGAAIDVNSNLFWWGRCGKDEEEVMPPSPISKKKLVISEVVCGGRFVAALNTEQKVHIWGRLVAGGKWMNEWRISSCERIVSMAAGRSHLAMLNDKGEVFSWGCNDHGQRGFPIENNDIVDQVKKFPFHHVCKEIACGLTSTLILTSNGDLWMCGGNPESYGYVITPENSITSVTKCEKLALGKKIASIKVGWGRHQGQYQSIYEATSVEGERLVWDDHSPPPLPSGKISKSTFIGLVSPRSNPFYVTHPRKIISSPCECHKSLEIKRITESMQIKLSALNELVLEIQNDIQLVKTARDVSLETQLIAAQEMINSLRLPKASISNQAGDGYAWD